MTVSGRRAGVDFQQTIQTPLINIAESSLPALVIGAFYQIIEALEEGSANPDAVALDSSGTPLVYDGQDQLEISFYTDPENLTGGLAIPSLLNKSVIKDDEYLTVILNPPGTDEFVLLDSNDYFLTEDGTSGEIATLTLQPGLKDTAGRDFDPAFNRVANVLIGFRAQRRDYCRQVLRTDANGFDSIAGGTYGTENPVAFALQKIFEVNPNAYAYAIAVDEVSDGEPDGTFAAWRRALDLAATVEAYTIVPLTRDSNVMNLVAAHVIEQSQTENRKERVGLVSRELPTNGANDILVNGIGTLQLVKAMITYTAGQDTGAEIIGEAVQGGDLDEKLAFFVTDSDPGGGGDMSIYAGNAVFDSISDGTVAAGRRIIQSSTDTSGWTIPYGAGAPAVGDLLKYTMTGTAAWTATTLVLVDEAGRNFKDVGVDPGDTVTIGAGIFTVLRRYTTTDPFDTLQLEHVSGAITPTGTGIAYSVETEVTITAIDTLTFAIDDNDIANPSTVTILGDQTGRILTTMATISGAAGGNNDGEVTINTVALSAGNTVLTLAETLTDSDAGGDIVIEQITVDKFFDTAADKTFVCSILDAVEQVIEVDLNGSNYDTYDVVSALNADSDASALATFYAGPNAVADVLLKAQSLGTITSEDNDFLNGDSTWRQFFTGADLSSLSLPTTPGSPLEGELDIYLDMESESRDALVLELRPWNGSVIVEDPSSDPLRPDLTGLKVTESYSLYNLGETLTITTPLGTEPDLQGQAETLAAFPARFATRRARAIWPDTAVTTVNGVQVEAPGYYLGATLAGLYSILPPEQGHSELPIPGWDSLVHSNTYFKESQLELLTAAGWWVYVQDQDGGPIVCRKQYTTDVSGDITAEASFTTITDDISKVIRKSVQPLLGVNNITPDLIERVRLIIQSVFTRYQNRQAIKKGTLNSLQPSQEAGDLTTLEADTTLEFYGPFNLLRVKIVI